MIGFDSFHLQGEEISSLQHQIEENRMVHAVLISGEPGTGKRTLAKLMAASLLCASDKRRPCGVCKNCLMTFHAEHPDLIVIEQGNPLAPGVKKDRTTIPVEDIREMIRLCNVRPTEGNMRVVLLFDAGSMTIQAQNCLLKTLEEPPSGTCIILVTEHPEALLSTVVSRCRILRLKPWNEAYIRNVLQSKGISHELAEKAVAAADGSIGRALELSADDQYWELREEVMKDFFRITSHSEVISISNRLKDRKQDADRIMDILDNYLAILTESRFRREKVHDLTVFPPQWVRFSANAEKEKFVLLSDTVAYARNQLRFSVNFQSVVEQIIFTFMREGNSWLQ